MKFEESLCAFERYGFHWGYVVSFQEFAWGGDPQPRILLPWLWSEDGPFVGVYDQKTTNFKSHCFYEHVPDEHMMLGFHAPRAEERELKTGEIMTQFPKANGKRSRFQHPAYAPRFYDMSEWGSIVFHNGAWHLARDMKKVRELCKQWKLKKGY
jgi:hypothetical protein